MRTQKDNQAGERTQVSLEKWIEELLASVDGMYVYADENGCHRDHSNPGAQPIIYRVRDAVSSEDDISRMAWIEWLEEQGAEVICAENANLPQEI